LSIEAFLKDYGTEEQCERALEALRWPQGYRCPKCRASRCSRYERKGRRYWQCSDCRHQTTVISGTIFEATKLPLKTWFLAMHLLTQSKNNVSALELKRHLGVSYPSAWAIKHKLMQVMEDRDKGRVLQGRVEIDDACLGGERSGTPGRGSENKVPFVAAGQTTADGKPQKVCLKAMRLTKTAIEDWARQSLAPESEVYSDALPSMKAGLAAARLCGHVHTGGGRQAALHPEFHCVNTVLGHLKTAISAPTMPSTSPNTPTATWPKPNTASTGVSICRSSLADCSAPVQQLDLIPFLSLDCVVPRFQPKATNSESERKPRTRWSVCNNAWRGHAIPSV
jgi:transposase-like protein